MGLSKVKNGLVPLDYNFLEDFREEDYKPWLAGIVHEVLGKFGKNPRWDFDELMSEAWLALVESSKAFTPYLSNSFLGFAKPYVYKRLLEFVSTNMYTFKVRYYNIKDDPETLERVNRMEAGVWTDSKSRPSSESDEMMTPTESYPSGTLTDEAAARREEIKIVRNILNTQLTKRQRKALLQRFRDDATFKDIGKSLGVSGESARELVNKGLEKLKFRVKDAGISDNQGL